MQVHTESAPPSPVENLRWLEDQLDVTYSPVCCSYNAGTTTLLLRLPNAACAQGGDCPNGAVGEEGASLDVLGWHREGSNEPNLVDIFGRMQDLEALQLHRVPGFLGATAGGLLDMALPQQGQQQGRLLPQGSAAAAGCMSQMEGEPLGSCQEDGSSNVERGEPAALSSAEFKQSEEAYGLRNFLNNCLMLPGTRRLSGGRKKKPCENSGARLKDQSEAPDNNRGLQFLQWRGRLMKSAVSSSGGAVGGGGAGGPAVEFADNNKMGGGAFTGHHHEVGLARERFRQAGRLLSLRRSKPGSSSDSGLANVASTLSVSSLG